MGDLYGEFICGNCQELYLADPDWDDEEYCEDCYYKLFPAVYGEWS